MNFVVAEATRPIVFFAAAPLVWPSCKQFPELAEFGQKRLHIAQVVRSIEPQRRRRSIVEPQRVELVHFLKSLN